MTRKCCASDSICGSHMRISLPRELTSTNAVGRLGPVDAIGDVQSVDLDVLGGVARAHDCCPERREREIDQRVGAAEITSTDRARARSPRSTAPPAMRVSSTAARWSVIPSRIARSLAAFTAFCASTRPRCVARATVSASAISVPPASVEVPAACDPRGPRVPRAPAERARRHRRCNGTRAARRTHSACHAPTARSCSCSSPDISVGTRR